MMAVESTELDDAIFPQPPADIAAGEPSRDVIHKKLGEKKREKNFESQSFDDISEKDGKRDKKLKGAKVEKKPSRIRRLFNGIRLKKSDSSGSDGEKDEESNETLQSDESDDGEAGGLTKRTYALTRIIHSVQDKANKMWEHIGQKLGGKPESDDEDSQVPSSNLLDSPQEDIDLSKLKEDSNGNEEDKDKKSGEDLKKNGSIGMKEKVMNGSKEGSMEVEKQSSEGLKKESTGGLKTESTDCLRQESTGGSKQNLTRSKKKTDDELFKEMMLDISDENPSESSSTKEKSGTLKRIASGLKNGLTQKGIKSKN